MRVGSKTVFDKCDGEMVYTNFGPTRINLDKYDDLMALFKLADHVIWGQKI